MTLGPRGSDGRSRSALGTMRLVGARSGGIMGRVVIINSSGQLANRMFAFANVVANAMHAGYEVVNPAFGHYGALFENLAGYPPTYPPRAGGKRSEASAARAAKLLKVANIVLRRAAPGLLIDATAHRVQLRDPEIEARLRSAQRTFLTGYYLRDHASLVERRASVREFFRPHARWREEAERLVAPLRSEADAVVGIHIRRGDYAQWQGGKYLFGIEDYARLARRLEQREPSRRLAFVVCSNEPVHDAFEAVDRCRSEPRPAMTDLCALSLCDAIVGPPSTFSLWAAYVGGAKLYHLSSVETDVSLDDFQSVDQAFLDQSVVV